MYMNLVKLQKENQIVQPPGLNGLFKGEKYFLITDTQVKRIPNSAENFI